MAKSPGMTRRLVLVLCLLLGLIGAPAASAQNPAPLTFAPKGMTTDRFPAATEPVREDIEAHDGILLHARVYRPDTSSDPDWKQPVILVHSPYYNGMTQGSATRSMDIVEYFTPKGYAVVLTDVRGTGNSGGCGEQDGPNQAQDFATLVEHYAAQDWSNGKVGSYGKSYDAETQHAGAVLAPKGLETMVSVAGISGLYDVAYFDGVPLRANGLLSAAVYELYDLDLPSDASYLPRRTGRHICQPANFVNGADPRGDMTQYWADREFRTGVENVTASTLYVMGLSDFTVAPIGIDGWYDELPTFKKAIFGQWAHYYPNDAPATWQRADWYDSVHAWLDHELLDLPTGVTEWPDVQVQSEHNTWRAVDSFAGMGTATEYQLTDVGTMDPHMDIQTPAPPTFREDGSTSWTSAPVTEELHLSGRALVDATITLDRPDGHFAVTLQEVRENGSTRTLTRGYLSAMHRESLTEPELVAVGEPVEYTIRTYPFDKTIDPGSSLRLVLAGYDGSTTPAGTLYTATVNDAVLQLPVADDSCGLVVAQVQEPAGEIAACPNP